MTISMYNKSQLNPVNRNAYVTPGHVAVWDVPARSERTEAAPAVRTLARTDRTYAPAVTENVSTRGDIARVEQWREHGRTLLAGIAAGFVIVVGVTMGMEPESTAGPTQGAQTVTAYTSN